MLSLLCRHMISNHKMQQCFLNNLLKQPIMAKLTVISKQDRRQPQIINHSKFLRLNNSLWLKCMASIMNMKAQISIRTQTCNNIKHHHIISKQPSKNKVNSVHLPTCNPISCNHNKSSKPCSTCKDQHVLKLLRTLQFKKSIHQLEEQKNMT